jgi:hypothetical protein
VTGPGSKKIGKITKINVDIRQGYGEDRSYKVELIPYAYPLKKDGTLAKVGEMRLWYGDKIELVEAAKP